jgi:hypothetical protein
MKKRAQVDREVAAVMGAVVRTLPAALRLSLPAVVVVDSKLPVGAMVDISKLVVVVSNKRLARLGM